MIGRLIRAALALAIAAGAARAADAPAITDAPTPGGLRLAHIHIADEIDQSIAFFWRDRSALADPTRAGLVELAPNLIVAGGGARFDGAAMDETLKDFGAALGLRRTATATLGELFAAARHFDAASETLADILAAPRLPARVLAREKAALLARLRDARQRPDRAAGLMLTRALAPGPTERALLLLDPPDTVARVEVADIDAWRRAALARDNLVVVAAGPLDRAAAAAIVDRVFANLPARAEPPPSAALAPGGPSRTIVVLRPVAQTALSMGAALRWPDQDAAAARPIITGALGGGPASRLWRAVRERLGATYGAHAWMQPLGENVWRFTMQSAVEHAAAPRALAAMREEYARLRADGLSELEVAPIRARLIAGQANTLSRAASAAGAIRAALLAGRPADAPLRAADEIAALSAERINEIVRTRLPERLTTIIVSPAAEGFQADCIVAQDQPTDVCD